MNKFCAREVPVTESATTLRLGGRHHLIALVDLSDLSRLILHGWHAVPMKQNYYAYARIGSKKNVSMARFIINAPPGAWVDHINGDTLDNRKANLRLCTPRQNAQNGRGKSRNNRGRHPTSRYKGVHWSDGQWRVQIRVAGKVQDVGWFRDEEEAARAYDVAALKHYGPFARVNLQEAAMGKTEGVQ
jgi:hypothetical protein